MSAMLFAQTDPTVSTGSAAGLGIFFLFYAAFIILFIASAWVIFKKAGKPGWAAIIPIYNTIVALEIVGRPLWWIVLTFIPFVNIIILIILAIDFAKAYGKSSGYAVGLIFLPFIFMPMLAWGDARYVGPVAMAGGYPPPGGYGYPPQGYPPPGYPPPGYPPPGYPPQQYPPQGYPPQGNPPQQYPPPPQQ